MQRMILAVNIANYEDIASNIGEVYAQALSNPNVLDVIVFLPEMSEKMVDMVYKLSEVIDSSGYLGKTHFLVSEEDKASVPFDYWFYFKEIFPKVNVCSKDDVRLIGDMAFKSFSSESFYSGELEEFLNNLYGKINDNKVEYCFAVDSSNDKDILKNVSRKFICLEAGEIKSFNSSKYNSNEVVSDYLFELGKFDKSLEIPKNEIFFPNEEVRDIEPTFDDNPILRKRKDSTKKKGRK